MTNKLSKRVSLQERPLGPQAARAVEMLFDNPNKPRKEIAQALGISVSRLGHIYQSERVRAMYPILARRRIRDMVPMATERLGELAAQRDNLEVSRKVVERVLDTSKVLESEPKIQINVFNSMQTDDLRRIVTDGNQVPATYTDAELVNDVQTSVIEQSSTDKDA